MAQPHRPIDDLVLEQLLERAPIAVDPRSWHDLLSDRTVLITGAGGSIGAELSRQLLKSPARKLILLDHAEAALFEALQTLDTDGRCLPIIADVRDARRIEALFKQQRPQVVLHAAAHKHVPLMEQNPQEAFINNAGATRLLAEQAVAHQTETFVLISTDKAVAPCSVMGASKRLAEEVVLGIARECAAKTRLLAVRFGNVLGSRGSVVPILYRQIQAGGPLTITDAKMQRYFITIGEASQLVLLAAAQGDTASNYILEMGKPIAIIELAQRLITLCGADPKAIAIKYTGIRPGERLRDPLDFEQTQPTRFPRIRRCIEPSWPLARTQGALDAICALDPALTPDELRQRIGEQLSFITEEPRGRRPVNIRAAASSAI